jgi:small-conductance mechanosensitive channel
MILDFAKTYIWMSSFQYRFYLLLETSLLLAVLIYFTYNYRKSKSLEMNKLPVIFDKFVLIAFVLITISYVSNILGYTNLTDFIILFCIRGGDLTLIFYAISLLLNGLLLGFTHHHFNDRLSSFDSDKKKVLETKLQRWIQTFAILLWLFYLLNLIDIFTPLTKIIEGIFSEPYTIGAVSFTLGTIFMFVTVLISSYFITRIISFLLDGNEIKLFSFKLTKGVPAAISLVIRYFILAFGFIVAISYLGIDLSEFNLLAGALGLGIGFGLQTIVSNFISGIILVFERPILTGDVVEVNNLIGTVGKIGVRASRINTYDGAEVVVPNNNLISEDLINWTLSNNIKRVEILIGTKYGTDPNEVLKILIQVANENEDVLKNPPPAALFDTFGDSSLNYRLLFWVYFQNGLQAKSDVSIAIYNRFEELGIEIPFPQLDVHLSKNDNSKLGPSND